MYIYVYIYIRMQFDNKLFLQLDSQDKALYLCRKFDESIVRLCLLAEKQRIKDKRFKHKRFKDKRTI